MKGSSNGIAGANTMDNLLNSLDSTIDQAKTGESNTLPRAQYGGKESKYADEKGARGYAMRAKRWLTGEDIDKSKPPKQYACCNCIFQHRRRTILFIVAMIILAILLIIIIQGVARATKLTSAEFYMVNFKLHDACTSTLPFTLAAALWNPSSVSASFDDIDAKIHTTHGYLGSTKLAGQSIAANKNQTFTFATDFQVADDDTPLKNTLQDFLDGEDIQYTVKVVLKIKTNVFLFPLSFTLPYDYEGIYYQTVDPDAPPVAELKKVTVLELGDPKERIDGEAFVVFNPSDFLSIQIPDLLFQVDVRMPDPNNVNETMVVPGAWGYVQPGLFGPKGGSVTARAGFKAEHVQGARHALKHVAEEKDLKVYLKAVDISKANRTNYLTVR